MLDKLKEKVEHYKNGLNNIDLLPNKVSPEIQEYRYNICNTCDKLWKPTASCKVCGCFMKLKTWMPNQSCPLKKWEAVSKNAPEESGAG